MKNKQKRANAPYSRERFVEWYHSTSAGKTLRDGEVSYFLNSLQLTYYQRILQVGRLGIECRYIRKEYFRNFALIPSEADKAAAGDNLILAKMEAWPIGSESVDTLILPHLIEFESAPQRVLAEAERVLRPEGRLFILGFNPWSLHGLLRHRRESPALWNNHFLACYQIMEWLNLLQFETEFSAGFGLSSSLAFIEPQSVWKKSIACLSSAYAVKAIKRTCTPMPVKQTWVCAPSLVTGQLMSTSNFCMPDDR